MAFRATHKPLAKSSRTSKTKDEAKVDDAPTSDQGDVAPAPVFSVEDLVGSPREAGAPIEAPVVKEAPVVEKPHIAPAMTEESQPPMSQPTTSAPTGYRPQMNRGPMDRPRYDRPQYSGGNRGGSPGGYQNYRRSGGYSHAGGQGRYNNGGRPSYGGGADTGGYRREWGNPAPEPRLDRGEPRFDRVEPMHTQDINVPTETIRGILDIMPEGHGFLRPKFTPSDRDIYISQSQIRRFLLRNGDMVEGQARLPKENERYWGLLKVEKVNDKLAEEMVSRPRFEDLTPIYPNKQLKLETGQSPLSTRIIDLVAPIGFGQRGLIVSPPKAGKTTILKELAAGIAANYPNVHLMAALIGERPEEVTDLSRSIKGEVLASNFDESPQEQTRVAEVALDRAKRLVEMGRDVVILLDSVTRLARAYNLVVNPSGRTLSGGFDPAALYPAKKFLGAARCVELAAQASPATQGSAVNQSTQGSLIASDDSKNLPKSASPAGPVDEKPEQVTGGSLTVIGTALVDTGSRMDDLIYEEFKGTGNMELHLSRVLQERRIFPAIDVGKSGTRHDELLLGEEAMKKVITLRHMLSLLGDEERTLMLIERLSKTKLNAEFLESLSKG